jgi:hypothetical protein
MSRCAIADRKRLPIAVHLESAMPHEVTLVHASASLLGWRETSIDERFLQIGIALGCGTGELLAKT